MLLESRLVLNESVFTPYEIFKYMFVHDTLLICVKICLIDYCCTDLRNAYFKTGITTSSEVRSDKFFRLSDENGRCYSNC